MAVIELCELYRRYGWLWTQYIISCIAKHPIQQKTHCMHDFKIIEHLHQFFSQGCLAPTMQTWRIILYSSKSAFSLECSFLHCNGLDRYKFGIIPYVFRNIGYKSKFGKLPYVMMSDVCRRLRFLLGNIVYKM